MREIVGKEKIKQDSFAKRLVTDNRKLTNKMETDRKLNEFFPNIGPKLDTNILDGNNKLESYIHETETFLTCSELSENESETVFKSLELDKAPGFDNLHVIVVKSVYDEIKESLRHIFKNSLKEGVFPEK